MKAFLYGIALQWKLDIRSKTLLITCYIVPLLFFGVMGSIFTSVMPDSKETLIQSMTIFGVTMGALIGVPPSLAEIYRSDVKKNLQGQWRPPVSWHCLNKYFRFSSSVDHERHYLHCRAACVRRRDSGKFRAVSCRTGCFHCCIPCHCKHHRSGCKGSGKNLYVFHPYFPAFYHAFRDYVSSKSPSRLS